MTTDRHWYFGDRAIYYTGRSQDLSYQGRRWNIQIMWRQHGEKLPRFSVLVQKEPVGVLPAGNRKCAAFDATLRDLERRASACDAAPR